MRYAVTALWGHDMESKNLASTTPTVFLLSPANLGGARAAQLLAPGADFETAMPFRRAQGELIAEAYSFVSSHNFRGNITHHQLSTAKGGILVIATGLR